MRKSRADVIRSLMNELRKDVDIKYELDLRVLQFYEKWEDEAIRDNTDEAVARIRKHVEEKKRKIYVLKSIGKQFEVVKGKIVKTTDL